MVDYYKILNVKRTASRAEIKTAYRRLARERHPDHNHGSEVASRDFALLALAYRTLSSPQERAAYDAKWQRWKSAVSSSSVLYSNNVHARRMRVAAIQVRLDRTVDRWLDAERRENMALQQAVFPTVTLFLSIFFIFVLKPRFWEGLGVVGRSVLVTLFLIGLWHMTTRLRASIERYTYRTKAVLDSLLRVEEKPDKPFPRAAAYAFLMAGSAVAAAAGWFLGEQIRSDVLVDMPFYFSQQVRPHLIFYPPIAVLIVDTMHSVASKMDS